MAGALLLAVHGCSEIPVADTGAHQSLVEIGERSLEEAEVLENLNRIDEASIVYRRALWAFRYHEKLTAEQPFLLDEAVEGVRRTAATEKR